MLYSNGKSRESVIVCSNHFVDGKPTKTNPVPTLFLTPFEHSTSKSPRKRRKLNFIGESSTISTSSNSPGQDNDEMDEMPLQYCEQEELQPDF